MQRPVCSCTFSDLNSVVCLAVRQYANIKPGPVLNVVKRNKDLKSGDFVVYVPSQRKREKEDANAEDTKENVDEETVKKEATDYHSVVPEASFSVETICQTEKGKFLVNMTRPSVFRGVVRQVLRDSEGTCKQCAPDFGGAALLNCPMLNNIQEEDLVDDWHWLTLDQLRLLVITEHVNHLLQGNGICVSNVLYPASVFVSRFMEKLLRLEKTLWDNVYCRSNETVYTDYKPETAHTFPSSDCLEILEKYTSSPYAINTDYDDENEVVSSSLVDKDKKKSAKVVLDLKKFVADNFSSSKNLPCLKNLNKVCFSSNLSLIHQVSRLECHRKRLEQNSQESRDPSQQTAFCVNVVSYEQEFSQQQTVAAWQILEAKVMAFKQVHVVCGSVSSRRGAQPLMLAQDFFQLRHQQMKDAFIMKYGEDVQGDGWRDNILRLTKAAIKFELLSTVCRQQVKLDLSVDLSSGGPVDNKGGVFVMYNYARLSTLFLHFEDAVVAGTYPALPDIDNVDFSTLKQEEEWGLLFNYVLLYPSLLRETIAGVDQFSGSIHTHKICQFLLSLSNSLSSYYSKTHILCEARSHLMPVMFARLYLMKGVQKVMQNCLDLLGVEPCAQL